ncbi:ATP-binding protein [Allomuricauda sp. SCSIO 65647]|uniref:tetratricopeptide repeat-containing sensor histidine kinase n=1 Tax=Allomuricauda sp. SCSIO 65647 TaxID=2908843 RepID=UPI001F1F2C77|nr:ATP-binding protein [Muricauda sp. SCSIO 65647]UJH67569.1 ATP-binding protein [Muricauda sp. SCSIO 65647]
MREITTKTNLFFSAALILFIWGCEQKKDYDPKNHNVSKDSVALWITEARNNDALLSNQKKGLLDKAFEYAEANYSDSVKTRAYSKISLAFKSLGDTLRFKKINADLMVLARKIEDYQSLGEAHWDLGAMYKLIKPDSAYYHYKEAYQLFLEADLEESAEYYPGWMLYAMAQVKNNNKDYIGAEKDIVKAISFFKENEIENRLFDAYNLLGNIQIRLNSFDKSLEYHLTAKDYLKENATNWFGKFIFHKNNVAFTYLQKKDYERAKTLYDELIAIDSFQAKEPRSYARALSSLAYAKFKNGDKNTDSIKQLLRQSHKILDSLGDIYTKARNHEFMAEVLAHERDTAKAIQEALASKTIAQETNNNDRLLSTFELLTKIDGKNSAAHATAYFNLNEELQAQERSIRDKFARIQMETDEVIEQNEALSRQKRIWVSVAVGLLLLAIAVYVIINQRAKNQKLKFQQKQQENNQEIYNLMLAQQGKFQEGKQLEQKRISEELHDGILGQMLGIRLILTGLNEREDEASVNQRAELIEKLRELEEEIRTISHELNAASYQKIHNFILAIDDLVKSIGESAKINCSFTYDDEMDWDKLSGNLKINMYRIVQESLQNCVKHAKCDNVLVNFEALDDNQLKVTINDDGKGFDINKGKRGIGLKNVISRVEKINGVLSINSKIGKGTSVTVTFDKIYNTDMPTGELLGSTFAQQT